MTKHLNHEAFDIVNDDTAYWIGFLFADGSVIQQQKGAPLVQLRLSEIDRGQLENFRQFLDSTHAISTSPPGNFGGYRSRASVRYVVSSRRLGQRLLELGRYEGPIAPELVTSRHFWRGVVDGDGSIYTLKTGYYGIGLVGSQRLLDAFLGFLRERNLSGRMTVSPHKSIHGVSTAGHLAELIIDELYRNAATALARKAAAAGPIIESVRARRIQAANDADELRERYEAGATLVELGRHYGVSDVAILYRMRRAGIPRRTPWPAPKSLPKSEADELRRLYVAGATLAVLARHYGVSQSTIFRRMQRAGIARRPPWSDGQTLRKSA
jgi:DNA invertase Pin-like site-specific DNA recombinase